MTSKNVLAGVVLTMLTGGCTGGEVAGDGFHATETTGADPTCFPLAGETAPHVDMLAQQIQAQLVDRSEAVRRSPTSDRISRWLLGDLADDGTYEDQRWAALIRDYMPSTTDAYHPLREDVLDAAGEGIAASLQEAAALGDAESGGWAYWLSLEETETLAEPLRDVVFYLRGRDSNGAPLSSCPVHPPADPAIEEALASDAAIDNQLGELARLMHVRRLHIPAAPWNHAPNEWSSTVRLVHTGDNDEQSVAQVAEETLDGFDWFFELLVEDYQVCDASIDPLVPESLDGACGNATPMESSWDPAVARAGLLEVAPNAAMRARMQALLDRPQAAAYHFQGYDVGAELFGETVIVIAPEGAAYALVVRLEYVHA